MQLEVLLTKGCGNGRFFSRVQDLSCHWQLASLIVAGMSFLLFIRLYVLLDHSCLAPRSKCHCSTSRKEALSSDIHYLLRPFFLGDINKVASTKLSSTEIICTNSSGVIIPLFLSTTKAMWQALFQVRATQQLTDKCPFAHEEWMGEAKKRINKLLKKIHRDSTGSSLRRWFLKWCFLGRPLEDPNLSTRV